MFSGMTGAAREKQEAEWLYGREDEKRGLFTGNDIDNMIGEGTMFKLAEARELMDRMKEGTRNEVKRDDKGSGLGNYEWDQEVDEVTVRIDLPEGTKAGQVKVKFGNTDVCVKRSVAGKVEVLLEGTLLKRVKGPEGVWSIADGKLHLTMQKVISKVHWLSLFEGGKTGEERWVEMRKQDEIKRLERERLAVARRFRQGDRVMVRLRDMPQGEEAVWAPGKVVEVQKDSMTPYGVVLEKHVPGKDRDGELRAGQTVTVTADTPEHVRAETCFTAAMAAAAATPAPPGSAARNARFGEGAKVVCRVDAARDGSAAACKWESGEIAAVDPSLGAEGFGAAYAVAVDGGEQVYAARDEHWLIRAADSQDPGAASESIAGTRFEKKQRGDGWVKFDHQTGRQCPLESDDDSD